MVKIPKKPVAPLDLVAIGETMAVVSGTSPGLLGVGELLRLSFAGAESNVLIAATRLGARTAWISRVGKDDFGRMIIDGLRGEGIDLAGVHVSDDAPTGLMVRHARTSSTIRATYYRAGSAANRLQPDDVDEEIIASARVLHVSGITPALGDGPRRTVVRAVEIARRHGVVVSVDVNYRRALWAPEVARRTLAPIIAAADIVFGGTDELRMVSAEGDVAKAARSLVKLGVQAVVLKNGSAGATHFSADSTVDCPASPAVVVDPVGAGDAFVGAYLSFMIKGANPEECLGQACRVGAIAVATYGDWEGLPRTDEIEDLMGNDDVLR